MCKFVIFSEVEHRVICIARSLLLLSKAISKLKINTVKAIAVAFATLKKICNEVFSKKSNC